MQQDDRFNVDPSRFAVDRARFVITDADAPPRVRPPMAHARTWQCGCGATLTIKAHTDRGAGPSNFLVELDHKKLTFGHSIVPSDRLNWEGLREERGWERDGDVVTCPACAQGRPIEEQRRIHRFEPGRIAAEIAARHINRQSGGAIAAEAVFTRLNPEALKAAQVISS